MAISGLILNRRLSQPIDDEEAIRLGFARTITSNTGIVSIEIEGEWGVVETLPLDPITGEFLDAGPGILIFRKINGQWYRATDRQILNAWLEEIPESILAPEAKDLLR